MIYDKPRADEDVGRPSTTREVPMVAHAVPVAPLASAANGGFQTKQDIVYRALCERILDCQLQPGQRLVIDDIASAYCGSPIPDREALHLLLPECLADIKPHIAAALVQISK